MALRLRSLLRATPRMPREDRYRLRALMGEVARAPAGDDVLPTHLCRKLQAAYSSLQPEGRLGFISMLARQDVDESAVLAGCRTLLSIAEEGRGSGAELRAREALREAMRPASQRVLEKLAQQEGGLRFLVSLRADLLHAMSHGSGATDTANATAATPTGGQRHSEAAAGPEAAAEAAAERERWRALDASLRRLLGLWFDSGLLQLQRLTYEATPAALLDKLIHYERVHSIHDYEDLRWRLGGPGRQLFAFLHPRMPGEPLVFVQTCLMDRVPSRLVHVLPPRPPERSSAGSDEGGAFAEQRPYDRGSEGAMLGVTHGEKAEPPADSGRHVAVFYSISSPFTGLRGVPLGGLLIKQVLSTLASTQRGLTTFVTLSPAPGFRSWLETRLARHAAEVSLGSAGDGTAEGSPNLPDATTDGLAASYVPRDEAACLRQLIAALDLLGLSVASPIDVLDSIHSLAAADAADAAVAAEAAEVAKEGASSDAAASHPACAAREAPAASVRSALLSQCARYLTLAKKRRLALDSVAAFHLRNGATLRAIHWGANPTDRGLRESLGIMVNYEYAMDQIEANHSAYVSDGRIAAAPEVWRLMGRTVDASSSYET